MNDEIKRVGETKIDTDVQENIVCRKIVKEILNFGINQRQIYFIMYLLSLELEDIDHMRDLGTVLRAMRTDSHVVGQMSDAEISTIGGTKVEV